MALSQVTQTEFQFGYVQGEVFLHAEEPGKTFVGDAVREHIPRSVVSHVNEFGFVSGLTMITQNLLTISKHLSTQPSLDAECVSSLTHAPADMLLWLIKYISGQLCVSVKQK